MIRTVLVDDEQNFLDNLEEILRAHHPDIKIEAACSDIEEAEAAINKFQPELVFLDVELGSNKLSFDLLKKIRPANFEIIFTTAYNKYALQAIKCSAIDYLLKPVHQEELAVAINKYKSRTFKGDVQKIENLLTNWVNPGNQLNKICLSNMNGYDLITIGDIVSCEGTSSQTLIVLADGKKYMVSKTLRECEEILTPYNFFRIHKSYLINLSHVRKFMKGKDGTVVMSNGHDFAVSRNIKEQFVERIKSFNSL